MTRSARPGDPQDVGGRAIPPHGGYEEDIRPTTLGPWNPMTTDSNLHEGSHHHNGGEEVRTIISRLDAGTRHRRDSMETNDPGQSTRESCESHYRGIDPNEHRTRRHKYDYDFPPDEKHRKAPYGQMKQVHTQERMHPTRFANAQRDMAGWKEYLAYAVKSPVFSFLCPL